jgi:GxxExxY protein
LGPGLLESAYQTCLALELRCRDIEVGCEVALPVRYEVIEIEEREGMRKSTSSPTAFLAFLASSR